MLKIKALLFDVFGTVVDWRTGVAGEVKKIANKYALLSILMPLQMLGGQNINLQWKKLEWVTGHSKF